MKNPWIKLPITAPYVLDVDAYVVREMNYRYGGTESKVVLDLLPEPYIGDVEAPVIFLSKNPGVDQKSDKYWHSRPDFQNLLKDNLIQVESEYPFFHLNPAIKDAPGAAWHTSKLNRLIVETSLKTVAQNVCSIPFFPYHTAKFSGIPKSITSEPMPSQRYTAQLVREAIARGAVIVITLYETPWKKLVPELNSYKNVFTLKSQNTVISQGNCDHYDEIVDALIWRRSV